MLKEKWLWMITMMSIIGLFNAHGCWEEERAALLHIKAYFHMHRCFTTWEDDKATSNCCDGWDGVSCGSDGRVVSLSLSGCTRSVVHLNASVFFPFQQLRLLDLSDNYIVSWKEDQDIAKMSSNLKNLETLDLSYNNRLTQLKGLQSLKHLSLQYNQIGGLIQHCGLCQLEKLQTLDLSYNDLDETLPPCLGNLTALRALDLSNNRLAGSVPSWLSNMSGLQKLNLSENHLTGNIASSVLANLTNLEILELAGNHFQISFKSFANHTKLKCFVVDFSEIIPDSDDQSSAPALQLQVLSLSNCRLTSYPLFLRRQYNLLVVDLSHNSLQGNFPTWLMENSSSLKGLFLHNNSISSVQLSSSLRYANMVALDISLNKIQGQIPEHIGDIFPQLQLLYMFGNELQGKIPWSLGRLTSLRELDLSNNSLIGTLPNSLLEDCSLLQSLILSNNHLEGQLPSFYRQHELEILILGNNSLEGPIPRAICRLHRLVYLDLSHNKLNGSIPSCFSNLSSIERLHLSNNKLRGQIILPNDPFLATLDLSNNKLYGSIPSQIANCTYLNVLLLRGNTFEGEIPHQLCSLRDLVILDLSHNMLSGSLPSCLGRVAFRTTQEMGIIMDDSLPDALVDTYAVKVQYSIGFVEDAVDFTTKSMTYSYQLGKYDLLSGIDLSYNMLTGKIPHELGNLTYIQSVNLSYNHLWGDIPKSFSNLTQIESLDLSYNSLSGSIPTELIALHFLAVFRVMHNNLSGKIPFAIQFSTFNESSYEGNPFLCGSPLSKKCALPPANANGLQDHVVEDDSGWIDMENFYVSFVVTGIIMFLVVLLILWINPNWRRAWFYLVTNCTTSSYYFVEDIIRKIKRVRNV